MQETKRCEFDPWVGKIPCRFYLVGGGAPLVICGVTAATNIRNYGMEAEDAA